MNLTRIAARVAARRYAEQETAADPYKLGIDYLVPLVPDDPNSLAFAGQGDEGLHHDLTTEVVAALQNLKNGEFFAMSGGHDNVARHIEFEAVRDKEADLIKEVEAILSSKFPWMMGGKWEKDTSWGRGGLKK